MRSTGGRAKRVQAGAKRKPRTAGAEELTTAVSIEQTTPGTALDDQLRREQAAALLALLAHHRGRR